MAIIHHAEEVTGNVAMTCRYYGISRQVFYVWYRRYEAEGLAGLRDRSTRPHHSPHETPSEVVGKILYLRQNYHFGPAKISMYLKRYHDVEVCKSGVWRILKRLDLNRLPASQRYKRHDRKWKRYEKPLPGHEVQIDVKFVAPLSSARAGKKYYQFTAIDDCTRLRVLRIYDRLNQKTAIQFVDFLLDKFPFRVEIDPDRQRLRISVGVPLAPAGQRHPPPLHQTRHPAAERQSRASHRIDGEEFYRMLKGVLIDDTQLFNNKLTSGRTSTTTIAHTAPSAARHPTNASGRRPQQRRPPSKRSTSAAQRGTLLEGALCRLRLMCDTVASLDARHSRNASGVERGRVEIPGSTVIWPCLRTRS